MWKDSLRVGIKDIDEQHRKLFEKTEELLKEVNVSGVADKQKCISTILFLKDYAVNHFAEEEAYQTYIGCKGYLRHKKLHEKFIQVVLEHEKKMTESDFSEKDVKEFTGMLVAWLLYHVSGEDQKIGKEGLQIKNLYSHSDIVCDSVFDVLSKLAGLESGSMKKIEAHNEIVDDDLVIEVEFTGDIAGYIAMVYPRTFIKNLIYSMMDFTPETIAELEISAMLEISDIITATVCGQIAKKEELSWNMNLPFITKRLTSLPDERITLDTGIGIIEADIAVTYN